MTVAEEIKILAAVYRRQLEYLESAEVAVLCIPPSTVSTITMTEPGEIKKTALQLAEDLVSTFINGGPCATTLHEGASRLAKLVMLKMLRMEMPHTSMEMSSLEHEIKLEAKRCP